MYALRKLNGAPEACSGKHTSSADRSREAARTGSQNLCLTAMSLILSENMKLSLSSKSISPMMNSFATTAM